ncbi:MAG: SctL family type III secretion system stator protein CdsL [Anaerolineae bacterium]
MTTGLLKSVKYERDQSHAIQIRTPKSASPPANSAAPDAPAGDTAITEETLEASPETHALINEAQAHVEMMLNQAQVQADRLKEEAMNRGYEAGLTAGKEAARKELQQQLARLQQIADAGVAEVNAFLEKSQTEIGHLAVAIAEKIITRELELNPKIITEIVGNAIKNANITGSCRIRVNPEDYELLGPLWETIPSLQPSDRKWELVSDRAVRNGGCVIEVDGGIIDAQVETQLAQVKKSFDGVAA